ncbi:hypothetical protein JB92DRAFT_2870714 [Gautieria morchelliformis]|nr:hypothetical protein JB92DRAFT_2870714 [Gautieria morchelliformis]
MTTAYGVIRLHSKIIRPRPSANGVPRAGAARHTTANNVERVIWSCIVDGMARC